MDFKLFLLLALLPVIYVQGHRVNCNCKPVNGGFTEWTQFTPCSKSCGVGTKTRYRYCSAPYAQYGGRPCRGPRRHIVRCKVKNCPRNGGWKIVKRSRCSKPCGGGKRIIFKKCINPVPLYCGKKCRGPATETHRCNLRPCRPTPRPTPPPNGCTKCEWNVPRWRCEMKCTSHGITKLKSCIPCVRCEKCKFNPKIRRCRKLCFRANGRKYFASCRCRKPTPPPHRPVGTCKACYLQGQREGKPFKMCRVTGLRSFCIRNKNKQSKNGGLPGHRHYWLHCSPDGPWCKPCATQTLVFNTKCDACEVTRNSKCSGPHRG